MKNVKALFIDCDGVLYDKRNCTYHDMAVVAYGKAMAALGIPHEELEPTRAKLKAQDVHGLFNAALVMCQKRGIPFNVFALEMVDNTDYSRIPKDKEMLNLLKKAAEKIPVYIVTNNTWVHLLRVLSQLNGAPMNDVFSLLNVIPITIENTLDEGVFHPKKVGTQFSALCAQEGKMPRDVLVLDDTQDVCDAALAQGLQVNFIETPQDTKKILRRIIHEDKRHKRSTPVRKTCGRAGR